MHTRRILAVAGLSLGLALSLAGPAQAAPTSWSPAADISTTDDAGGQQLAAAPDGTITAVWFEVAAVGSTRASVSADRGLTWSSPVTISSSPNERDPQIAVDGDGVRTVSWISTVGFHSAAMASSSPDGVSWSPPTTLSATDSDAGPTAIVIDPAGLRYVVWQQDLGGSSVVHVSTSPDGLSWSTPREISTAGLIAQFPHLVVHASGAVSVIWTLDAPDGVQTTTTVDGGATWSPPVDLVPSSAETLYATLAANPGGGVAALWTRAAAGATKDVEMAVSPDGYSWGTPVTVSTPGTDNVDPSMAYAPDGTLHATWTNVTTDFLAQTAHSTDNGSTWSAVVDLTVPGTVVSLGSTLVIDSQSNATILWQQGHFGDFPYIEAATSTDGGATYPLTLELSAAAPDIFYGGSPPRGVVTGDDVITASWGQVSGTRSVIQAARSFAAAPTPEPALAATGNAVSALPTGLLGAGLIGAGALLVLPRRRHGAHRA